MTDAPPPSEENTPPTGPPSPPVPPVAPTPAGPPAPPTAPGYSTPGYPPPASPTPPGYPAPGGYAGAPPVPPSFGKPTETTAIVGLVLAFVFWPAGLVVSIIALVRVRKTGNGGFGLALGGAIVSVLALFATMGLVIFGVVAGLNSYNALKNSGPFDDSPITPAPTSTGQSIGMGETATALDGTTFTVTNSQCGIASVGDSDFGQDASGQYCKVDLTVGNSGTDTVDFLPDLTEGYSGGTKYQTDVEASFYTDDPNAAGGTVDPGASLTTSVYFDIPVGATLDSVVLYDGYMDAPVTVTLH